MYHSITEQIYFESLLFEMNTDSHHVSEVIINLFSPNAAYIRRLTG